MGYRLHYAKTYKVEYSTSANFSWRNEEINELLMNECPDAYLNSETGYCGDELEISKQDLSNAITSIREKDVSVPHCELPLWMREDNISYADISDFLQEALDRADKDNDFVRFQWF